MAEKCIEDWKNLKEIKDSVFEGVKAFKNWKRGKQVSEEEFDSAVSAFMTSSVAGKKEAKG